MKTYIVEFKISVYFKSSQQF